MATKIDITVAIKRLQPFISKSQLRAIVDGCYGEEQQFFIDKALEYGSRVNDMHTVYGQDGLGDNAIAHLHYFVGGVDAYITERDVGNSQHQAFGIINIGYGFELGYISIQEMIDNGAELDLYFDPKPVGELKG